MANIKSAKKRVLVIAKKTLYNKNVNSALKTYIKKAEGAVAENKEDKALAVKAAIKKIDSAVSKGIWHKNKAARKKSQLARKLNQSA